MGKLKPIGSEKLTGQDKINRMLEIARFNESKPSNLNETSRTDYEVGLADGNKYLIVKEKMGYIIKKGLNESTADYIEPMKNRKYYSSYSQALKRMNLLAGELNRLNENEEGVNLFSEQKKFVLKTPKPATADADIAPPAAPPAAPPPVPAPELPPSPLAGGDAMGPEGGMDMGMAPEGGMDMGMAPEGGDGMDMTPEGGDEMDMGPEITEPGGEEKVTFRSIQKLTGKLTQKLRTMENEEGLTSENIKYVINMLLSAVDLGSLSEEDKEDIISKFDEEEGDEFGGDFGGEDITSDTEVEDIQSDMDIEIPSDAGEMMEKKSYGAIIDSIFAESKVDQVLSKYFVMTKKEIVEGQKRKARKLLESHKQLPIVVKMSQTFEQELAAQKFLEENFDYKFIGRTNRKNLIFEKGTKQVKISPEGYIL